MCFALLWFLVFGKIKEEKKQNDTQKLSELRGRSFLLNFGETNDVNSQEHTGLSVHQNG